MQRFSRPQLMLIGAALVLIAAMLVIVPLLTTWLGPRNGYLGAFLIYWFLFCLPLGWFGIPAEKRRDILSFRLGKDWWIPLVVAAQVTGVCLAAFVPHAGNMSVAILAAAAITALLNGFFEEFAWRGAFIGTFADKPRVGFWIGWALFSAWHIPLALAVGVTVEGGGAMLVGSAAGLGLLWGFVAWRVRAIGWTVAAHVLTNFFAFSNLILANHWL